MDNTLIQEFRKKVNDGGFVLKMYQNRDGRNKWNIVCSAMDWIDVVVENIDKKSLLRDNSNEASTKMMMFIISIDILWEAVQQLHRVFFNTDKIPFASENSTFARKLFPMSDNNYFKTLRACFAAHPVNLEDTFRSAEKEQRYASWSGGGFGAGDFSVILYSNLPNIDPLFLNIYFDELLTFAQIRYNHLHNIMQEIDRQIEKQFDIWRKQPIKRVDDPQSQIDILLTESSKRFDIDYYRFELEKLRIIFSTPILSQNNLEIVQQYRAALLEEIDEIYDNLQQMNLSDLESTIEIDDLCPADCQYAFEKLTESVYGDGYPGLVSVKKFKDHLSEIVDFSELQSMRELYVIVNAGFFIKNMNSHSSNGGK